MPCYARACRRVRLCPSQLDCEWSEFVKTCAVSECDRSATTKGWCPMHYMRWHSHGDPLALLKGAGTAPRRFWEKVEKTETCWLCMRERSRGRSRRRTRQAS